MTTPPGHPGAEAEQDATPQELLLAALAAGESMRAAAAAAGLSASSLYRRYKRDVEFRDAVDTARSTPAGWQANALGEE